jgi:hypothetical protein
VKENVDGLSTNIDKVSSSDGRGGDDDNNNNNNNNNNMITWQCFPFCY